MGVAERVHEVTGPQPADLGDHGGEQGVRGDVERDAEEDVGRALVELAGQPAVGDVELEHRVARRQRHVPQVGDVPGADQVPPGVRVGLECRDHRGQLVDVAAVRGRPGPPLVAVDRAELTVRVGPLVPDRHALLVQPLDVGRAGEEPEQLRDHRPGVHALGGEQREAVGEVEAHLVPEDAERPGAGPVGLARPGGQHVVEQVEIGPHRQPSFPAGAGCRSSATRTGAMARMACPRWLIASLAAGASSALVTVCPSATNSGS